MSDGNLKAPSQVFKWFEKMKDNYDKNILALMQRFEQNNNLQQSRLDKAHESHINIMRENHLQQVAQFTRQVEQQSQEIAYFKQQLSQQQQTITQLNNRYDAVMVEFIASKQQVPFKDIFDDGYFVNTNDSPSEQIPHANTLLNTNSAPAIDINQNADNSPSEQVNNNQQAAEKVYQSALKLRQENNLQLAFTTFTQAAKLGHYQAMGALGRAYFLSEGTTEDPIQGLAWLINAAELGLPQAIKRVEHFKSNEAALYQDAVTVASDIAQQLLTPQPVIDENSLTT